MIYEAAMLEVTATGAAAHLLQHYGRGLQEDLCFALWRPSTGSSRITALIYKFIPPLEGERLLHGNASFNPGYLARSIRAAAKDGAGLAFMHSHPGEGWQGLSKPDHAAEQLVISPPAAATGLPLVGLTIGIDGYWSARFWKKADRKPRLNWCRKVRVVGEDSYKLFYNDNLSPYQDETESLKRTIQSWGHQKQQDITRMKIGIVGLGSVGCIVAETLARIGISNVVLIDHDIVEEHNLDRLLYATKSDIGKQKVSLVRARMRKHSTASKFTVVACPSPVHNPIAYKAALDCDLLFSCVDRPVGRDTLNHIANAHLIPVIDGGVSIQKKEDMLHSAHWQSHLITPYHQCLRCNGQYSTGMVSAELDGSLDNPSYIANLPLESGQTGQNIFPFAMSVASMEANLMVRYMIGQPWWPPIRRQNYDFIKGKIDTFDSHCNPTCEVRKRTALGDAARPPYYIKVI